METGTDRNGVKTPEPERKGVAGIAPPGKPPTPAPAAPPKKELERMALPKVHAKLIAKCQQQINAEIADALEDAAKTLNVTLAEVPGDGGWIYDPQRNDLYREVK